MRRLLPLLLVLAVSAAPAVAAEKSFAQARAALLKGLRSNDSSERAAAVYEVDGFDTAEAARLVVRAVLSRDDRARVIRAGIQLASAFSSKEAIDVLVEESKKGAWAKRARVLEAMGGIESDEALAAVLFGACDEEPRVRIGALLALEHKKGENVATVVADALKAKEWPVRSAAIYVMGRMRNEDAVVPLIRRLGAEGEGGRLREDARRALKRITHEDFGLDFPRWAAWYSENVGKEEAVSLGPAQPAPAPTAQLAGVETVAKRVVFVLAVNDTMNKPLTFDPDRIAPPDVRAAGGRELAKWREVKTKLDLARLWIAWAIDHLAPETEFNIVTYGVSANASFASFLAANPGNREKAKKRVLSLSASANANLYDGLKCIFTLVSKDPLDERSLLEGPEVVFFLSDGAADEGEIKSAFEAFEEAERWNRYRQIRFHCFGVGDHDPRVLADLAGMVPDGEMRTLP